MRILSRSKAARKHAAVPVIVRAGETSPLEERALIKASQDESSQADLAAQGWTAEGIIRLQMSKLLNYYQSDLVLSWGGIADDVMGPPEPVTDVRIARILALYTGTGQPWMHKLDDALPWGASNVRFDDEPWDGFGQPYEPYIQVQGQLMPLKSICDLVCIDYADLLAIKLKLLVDELVLDEALKSLLQPRSAWKKV